jgi:hypothetical protein
MNDPNNKFVVNDQKVSHLRVHTCPICGNRHEGLVPDVEVTSSTDDEHKNRFDLHDAQTKARRRGEVR